MECSKVNTIKGMLMKRKGNHNFIVLYYFLIYEGFYDGCFESILTEDAHNGIVLTVIFRPD